MAEFEYGDIFIVDFDPRDMNIRKSRYYSTIKQFRKIHPNYHYPLLLIPRMASLLVNSKNGLYKDSAESKLHYLFDKAGC